MDEAEDFELDLTPRPPHAPEPAHLATPLIQAGTPQSAADRLMIMNRSRTGSMATVRVQRRAKLADKLKDVFELAGIEEVRAGEGIHSLHLKYLTLYRNALLVASFCL